MPQFVGSDISKSPKLCDGKITAEYWQAMVLKLYSVCGLSEGERKRLRITAHSPHATCNTIACVLQWNDTARSDLGRWAHVGGQHHMPHRYASRASAINQMYLRATVIQAVRELTPSPIPRDYDVEQMRASPHYASSLYVGPFVMFNVSPPSSDEGATHVFI